MENTNFLPAIIIFLVAYGIIISEKLNRTVVALLGAIAMVVFHILSQEEAFHVIDFNTIGLLVGMMTIVNILKRTGIFQYIAIKTAKLSKGSPWKIMLYFSVVTAVASALLDNVTTILLIAPVTFVITETLGLNPVPFLITEVLTANIGGTATLIGDPPNIMIGGATNLSFMDFLINLGPVVVVIFIVVLLLLKFIYGSQLKISEENKAKIAEFDETKTITDPVLLKKSGIVLLGTIIGFAIHQSFGLESATIALLGAGILLLISKVDVEEILTEVEWPTIFFFMGLFIMVGALEEIGVIEVVANQLISLTHGNVFVTTMLILWVAAIASAFLDNIPFVATMIPLIHSIGATGMDTTSLWWALALGACLGGNGSVVGATANVIVSGMLHKKGYKLTFGDFLKIGFPLMLISVFISMIYLIIFYV
ncbi:MULTISPECIES: ArsB/NhaD family transporter [Turicibacter]|uniref:Arsenical pump family protein n=1 Tax=Turicibacter faecis TaxID=2963365 RepID=A0ABN6ZE31_9FIRM|nr:ArsB/NhaD family transporter [Turicibacter sp. 1E2]MCU7209940.1 ArsB/NhaD family transporter [Turicibacter sp. 1E2]BEH91970.1 arsenical pump family protein [Turicibacter sp. TC023]